MKHKYPINTWVRFYRNNTLIIAVVQYLSPTIHVTSKPVYYTDFGPIDESEIIEARLP